MILAGPVERLTTQESASLLPRPRAGAPRLRHLPAGRAPANPYLTFANGSAREAMEHYASVLGGELRITTFGDAGIQGRLAPLVSHAQLSTAAGLTLLGADVASEAARVSGDNVSVGLSGGPADADRLRGWFAALSEGGEVREPLSAAPTADERGVLVDRYGIRWTVDVAVAAD